jgi:hypothetical protein
MFSRKEVDQQARKTLWSSHSRIENKGLGVAAGPLLGCTAFMRFRGPQAFYSKGAPFYNVWRSRA